jgi:NADH-quinone oxidoreductase subunit N
MTFEMLNLTAAGPEILLLVGACTILMVDAFRSQSNKGIAFIYWLSLTVLLLAGGMVFLSLGENGEAFNGHFYNDGMGGLLKTFLYLLVGASFVYSRHYVQQRRFFRGEFFVLGLFAVLGMSVTISAGSFITLFMGLELLSLPLYGMVALDCDSPVASEAAMKYFIRGAIASGMLLYGMSLLYGATGSLNLHQVAEGVQRLVVSPESEKLFLLIFGTVLVVTGISFKFGSLPLQMWVPELHQNVSRTVTLFLGVMPKLAAFAMVVRILVGTLNPFVGQWQQLLAIVILLSMTEGGNLMGRRYAQSLAEKAEKAHNHYSPSAS